MPEEAADLRPLAAELLDLLDEEAILVAGPRGDVDVRGEVGLVALAALARRAGWKVRRDDVPGFGPVEGDELYEPLVLLSCEEVAVFA